MSPAFNPKNPNQQFQQQQQQRLQDLQRQQQQMGAMYEMEKKRKKQKQIQDAIDYGKQQAGVGINSDGDVDVRGDVVGGDKTFNVNVPQEEELERSGCANSILKIGMFALVWVVCSVFAGGGLGLVGYVALGAVGAGSGSETMAPIGSVIGAVLGVAFAFAFALSAVSGKKKSQRT